MMLRSLKQNLRISQEFDIARRMQAEMLPKAAPQISGLRIESLSLPATEVAVTSMIFCRSAATGSAS